MNFYLSERGPLNSTFAAENGQIIYKVNTPMRLGTRTSTISKIMPNDVVLHQEDEGEGEVDMRDRFALLAVVEHKPIKSSVIKFGGTEVETLKYFRKEGRGPRGP